MKETVCCFQQDQGKGKYWNQLLYLFTQLKHIITFKLNLFK